MKGGVDGKNRFDMEDGKGREDGNEQEERDRPE